MSILFRLTTLLFFIGVFAGAPSFALTSTAQNDSKQKIRQTSRAPKGQTSSWFTKKNQPATNGSARVTAREMQENAVLGTTHKKPKEKHDTQEQAKTDISIQYNRNSHSWRENPNHTSHPITDENVGLQGEHRIQALTKLDHSDDVDISAGPELIIKDDKHNASFKTGDQPDSELGIGMHFKYDF